MPAIPLPLPPSFPLPLLLCLALELALWRLSVATLATFVCGSDLFLLNCKKLAALVWWQISSPVYEPRTLLCGTRLPIVQIVETLCKFLYCFSLYLPPSLALFSLLFALGSFVCSRGGRQKDRSRGR